MVLWSRFAVPVGWFEILKRTAAAIYRDDCFGWAAELAYYLFFALFPALLFAAAVIPYLHAPYLLETVIAALGRMAPADVVGLARSQLGELTARPHPGLMTVGIVAAVWSMSSALAAVMDTLNQAYHVSESRPWWRVRLIAGMLLFVLIGFGLTAFLLMMAGPALAEYAASAFGLGPAVALFWRIIEWPVVIALVVTGVALVYYYAPDVEQQWIWLTPGSLVATVLWVLMSLGLRWYVSRFGNYQSTYGAIGGAILALLWLYYSGLTLLLGAELNATIEHASLFGKDEGEKVSKKPAVPPPEWDRSQQLEQ